jgi:hypothetical protein
MPGQSVDPGGRPRVNDQSIASLWVIQQPISGFSAGGAV